MEKWEYTEPDNMPVISCQCRDILWEENRALTLEELTRLLNLGEWPAEDVIRFLRQLLIGNYAEKKQPGFTMYDIASDCESTR